MGASLVLFAVLYTFTAVRLLNNTNGHLTYALDDAYIHMAIAKNLALHGVWGVQPDAFAAASSSPLWTALLALTFTIDGPLEVIPLILTTTCAVLTIIALGVMLDGEQIHGLPMFVLISSVVLIAPLVPMVWIGMEHSLHILLTLLTAWTATDLSGRYSRRRQAWLCVLAMFTVATRYEGLFVVAGCALLLMLSRRRAAAVTVAVAGGLPVAGVGVWNVWHGWFFLPASIMMKQTVLPQSSGGSVIAALADNIAHAGAPAAFLVLLASALLLIIYRAWSAAGRGTHPLLVVFAAAALLHLLLAKFGWLFRYESYLMALGAFAVGVAITHIRIPVGGSSWRALAPTDMMIAGTLVLVLAARDRTITSHAITANVAGHIFRQHRQVAALLQQYFDGEAVAMNDIGVVSFYSGVRVFDLVGLATLDAASSRRAGQWDAAQMNASLSHHHVDVAVVYDTWFQGDQAFHREWERIGEWTTDREDVRSEGTVTFFARTDHAGVRLRAALQEFNPRLPPDLVETRTFEPGGTRP